MKNDLEFRIIIVGLFIGMQHLRRHLRHQIGWKASWPAMKKHPLDTVLLMSVSLLWLAAVMIYGVFHGISSPWGAHVPTWIRWCALVPAMAGLALIAWSDRCLGENLSVTLRIRDNHTLVTSGPYRRIRHPIYTGALLYAASLSVISANYVAAFLFFVPMAVLVAQRLGREEQMMIDEFGDEYRQFMKRTGRLLPKWWTSSR